MKNNLKQGLGLHIKKSYTEGIYSDNSQNRKLGRVGMSYGHSLNLEGFEDIEDSGEGYVSNPKQILKRAKGLLSDRAFKLVKDLVERKEFRQNDIYINDKDIYFDTTIEVNPERDKDIINLGKRVEEDIPKKENDYYEFIRKTWSPQQLEDKWLSTFEREESWGKAKYYSMLYRLKIELEQRRYILDQAKRDLWWKKYDKGIVPYNSDYYSDITDEEAEKYIKIHGSKASKDMFSYGNRHYAFIKSLEKYGIDFNKIDKENPDEFKKEFKDYIINCPRNDFYQMVKGCSADPTYIEDLIRLRFAFKYNKMIAGSGWGDINNNGKIDIKKRDEVLELCKQIEYSVDDVLGEDKDLFINNPNIDYIRFDKNTDWGGASYNKYDKTITITSEYFQKMKESRKNSKKASTLSREKFMVEGFIHEIGHSLDVTKDIYESTFYKDFAKHLGYDKNAQYTIYTNAINQDAKFFNNQDYYLQIEKDKKEDLYKKFGPLYEKYTGFVKFNDRELKDIFISEYSSKSACEGFAEYFSFYMGNKKKLDKEIAEYKSNPKKYLENVDISSWYKYSIYGGKWKILNSISEKYKGKGSEERSEALKKYYQTVVEHNIEMLSDIQNIVKLAKKKM